MDSLTQMRLGILKEIKQIRIFFDNMERNVKTRDPKKVMRAYTFLCVLVEHMDKGDLTPISIELREELTRYFQENRDGWDTASCEPLPEASESQ